MLFFTRLGMNIARYLNWKLERRSFVRGQSGDMEFKRVFIRMEIIDDFLSMKNEIEKFCTF